MNQNEDCQMHKEPLQYYLLFDDEPKMKGCKLCSTQKISWISEEGYYKIIQEEEFKLVRELKRKLANLDKIKKSLKKSQLTYHDKVFALKHKIDSYIKFYELNIQDIGSLVEKQPDDMENLRKKMNTFNLIIKNTTAEIEYDLTQMSLKQNLTHHKCLSILEDNKEVTPISNILAKAKFLKPQFT